MAPQVAIGIVRVSQVRGREGDSFASPGEQRERIETECEQRGLHLGEVIEEMDVSGGKPLAKREGLRRAVEAVEAGEAHVIAAAYLDRLCRSLRVQDELVSRVEKAGGQVLAVDVGRVSNGSATPWLSSTLLGAFADYQRRVTAERVSGAQKRAVARGVAPWRHTTPGYTRDDAGVFAPNETAPAVAEAFRMRAEGRSIRECRQHLKGHGIERTLAAVSRLFHDRAVLGELHFGELHNLTAHPPIITADEFKRAGRASAPRGRVSKKSQLLLARLGVLRCETCNSRLCAGTSNHGTTPIYRCRNVDCTGKVTISAKVAEQPIIDAVRAAIRDVEGRASAETNIREAELAAEQAQAELDSALRTFAGFEDETAARERLKDLREVRDQAEELLTQLGGHRAAVTVSGADWDRLSLDGRRALIRATIAQALVSPGRGADRVRVELVGE